MFDGNNSLNDIDDRLKELEISNLPISRYRDQIINTVRNNQVTVIYGDTGSGKTTQIPQYLLADGINNDDIIAVTQPRRLAAISMARRVAQEMNCGLGIEVGYEVRFESHYGASTKIKYMTDGMMLNHCLSDPRLSEYSVIMIDEAHERSIHTDVLLGLLKKILTKRKDLKVLITSATIKTEKFSTYFNDAPIISFEGRLFPIEVIYQRTPLYIEESVEIVERIHRSQEKGDILIFLTGEDDIDTCCRSLKNIEHLIVLPLCGSMDCDTQRKVFAKVDNGQRKVVVATNIAETTITIEGIKFVIDCGYVKQNIFNASLGMDVLLITRISKAQADQRKGRAGRTSNGICYRLYDEKTLIIDEAVPEILRINLCEIYLKIVAIGLDPMNFEFIDPPNKDRLMIAKKELEELDLLTADDSLTEMGLKMHDLPVEPILGKVLLSSAEFRCTKDIVTILSMMTEKNVFKRSKNHKRQNQSQKAFADPFGDHFTRLNVFNEFIKNGKSKTWCYSNFLNYDTLLKVDQVRDQLIAILRRKEIALDSLPLSASRDLLRKALIKGYYRNICTFASKGVYHRCLGMETLYIHPGSCLFHESPSLIMYHEIVHTTKRYMHGIMKIDELLLTEFPNEMKKINYKAGGGTTKKNFMDFF